MNFLFQILVSYGGFNLEAVDHQHQTTLHYAAKNGHLNITKYLVSEAHVYVNPAANDNEQKRTFVTPLDLAIAHNHSDVANFIITKGNCLFNFWLWDKIPKDI